jgi:hypothetical protein
MCVGIAASARHERRLADFHDWSDRAIAKHVGVGNKFVGDMRSLCSEHSETPDERNLP